MQLDHRRQALLFLVAMGIPCAALVLLGVNLVRQERELAGQRRDNERARALEQLRNDLLIRLERLRLDEFGALRAGTVPAYRHPEVALVALVQDGAVELPWDSNPAAGRFRGFVGGGEFGRTVREAEHLELVGHGLEQSAMLASKALTLARNPAQRAYARLVYARVLLKLGRQPEALRELRSVLEVPHDLIDEIGVPLKLYAAEHLLRAGPDREYAARAVTTVAAGRPLLAPLACELMLRLLDLLPPGMSGNASMLRARTEAQIALMQQAEMLRNDYPRLRLRTDRWLLYGEPSWLVSAAPPGLPEAVIAVRTEPIFSTLKEHWSARHWAVVEFVTDGPGQLLGDSFPGLRVALELSGATESPGRETYLRQQGYIGLTLLAAAMMLIAWLLWRDLRREVQTADLRSQFVSSVSHELKTPLTAIRMFAETLQLGRISDEDKRSEYAATIVSECERLSRLVDDVLAFSKIQRGRKTYRFRSVGLGYIVRSAVRAVEYPMARQGFELETRMPEELPRVYADADALEQAVLNLLSNAMKYSGESRTIGLSVERAGREALIRVTDHGLGIAPEYQSRIFEQYYRAPTRENELVPGAGVGLALVAHIVKAHGGRVELESAPGRGSTFQIRLPIEEGS